MRTRSNTKGRKRIREALHEQDVDISDLTFTKDGKYVCVDSNLIKKLKKTDEPVVEPERPNPFEHLPEYTDVLSSTQLNMNTMNKFSKRHNKNKNAKNMAEMIGNLPIDLLALRRSKMKQDDWEYEYKASVTPRVTDQYHSGRCWMFAGLNVLRYSLMKKFNLDDSFEFSASYLFFYDKIERSNFYLESLWSLKDKGLDDRYVRLFTSPGSYMSDGGFYEYFTNLVCKYGLVPKTMYNDSYNCVTSDSMNEMLQRVLNNMSLQIYNNRDNWSQQDFEKNKLKWMSTIYDLMCRFMSEPPSPDEKFDWVYKDSAQETRKYKDLTPITFYREVVPHGHYTKLSIINDPRHPENYYKLHTVEFSNNMVDGNPVTFLNLPMDVFKRVVAKSLKNDDCVWFACDVGQCIDYEQNTLDTERYDYKAVLGTEIEFDKADMLRMFSSQATHAMVLNGVDMDDSDPDNVLYKKWRVENSWGLNIEMAWAKDHGYWKMSDDHFEKYTYMATVDLKYLGEDVCKKICEFQGETIVFKPWDAFSGVAFGGGCNHCKHGIQRKHLK